MTASVAISIALRPVLFAVTYNGAPMTIAGEPVEHLTIESAWERAWRLSEEYRTDINCFGVARSPL